MTVLELECCGSYAVCQQAGLEQVLALSFWRYALTSGHNGMCQLNVSHCLRSIFATVTFNSTTDVHDVRNTLCDTTYSQTSSV